MSGQPFPHKSVLAEVTLPSSTHVAAASTHAGTEGLSFLQANEGINLHLPSCPPPPYSESPLPHTQQQLDIEAVTQKSLDIEEGQSSARLDYLVPASFSSLVTYDPYNTVAIRLFGEKIGIAIHSSFLILNFRIILNMLGQLLCFLVMFGVLPTWISWFSLASFVFSLPAVILQLNLDLLLQLVFTFEEWFTTFYVALVAFFLLPDLCEWDERAAMFIGWGLSGCVSNLVDCFATEQIVRHFRKSFFPVICGLTLIAVSVQKNLFNDLHPRAVDLGVTTFSTQSLLVTSTIHLIVYRAKELVNMVRFSDGTCNMIHDRLIRKDIKLVARN